MKTTPQQESKMKPNKYQSAIVEWVRNGRGHGAVSAVAGSGKTTTLVHLVAPELRGSALFVAFNKSIASELGARLSGTGVSSSTIHSAGFSAVRRTLGRVDVRPDKGRDLARELIDEVLYGRFDVRDTTRAAVTSLECNRRALPGKLARVWELVRMTGARDPGSAADVAAHYDLDVDLPDAALDELMVELARRSMYAAERLGQIDFTDMLYLVWVYDDVRAALRRYDWLLVDEAQDLNWLQREVCTRMLTPGGRMLLVGDPKQAIYGFAGSANDAFDQLVDAMDATVLPLSVCYRCPTSHVQLAQEDVPHIEAADGAPEGELEECELGELVDRVAEGDLVLCRTTAPLVQSALACIREGVPACVRGRDIGAGLTRLWREGAKRSKGTSVAEILDEVSRHVTRQLAALADKRDTEMQQLALTDRLETLRAIAEPLATPAEVETTIDTLFDENRGSVVFSSIHRAKGLEAERVHLIRPDLLPHPMARGWQAEQESHLRYVAHTRAKRSLTIYEGLA